MALLERLAILITADAAGAINEMKKVADEAEKNLGKAGAAGSTLSGQMTKVGAVMVGVGAGMLAVGINAANTTESLGKEVIKLQRYTGLSAEEASKLGYAARMSGVDVDSLSLNLARMAKQMDTSPQKFTALGVEVKTADGHMRSMTDVLLDVADKFQKMGPGTETSAKALELFGRQGANMLPFLLKGKQGIQELTGEAEKMGLVLSQDNVNAVKDHIKAQRELNAAIDGIKNQIGQEMLPILTDFTKLIAEMPGPLKDVVGPIVVLGGAITLLGGFALVAAGQVRKLQTAYTEMSGTGQTVVKALGIIGGALITGVALWIAYEQGVKRAHETAKAAGEKFAWESLAKGVDVAKESLSNFQQEAQSLQARLNNFHIVMPWDRASAEGSKRAAQENARMIQSMIDQADYLSVATGRSNEQTLAWIVSMHNAGTTFDTADGALAAYTGNIDTNRLSAKDAAQAQDGLATSVENANNAYRAAIDPFFAVIHAQEDLAKSKKDYNELVKSGTASQDDLDASNLKIVESAAKLNSSLVELGKATISGTTDTEKFKQAMEMLRQYGIDPSSEQGQRLIEKIAGIRVEADVTARYLNDHPLGVKADDSSVEAVIRRLQTLRGLVNPVTGTVALEDIWSIQYQALGGRVGQGYAAGGRPQPYIVGELGPELFVPDTAGTILTADKTAQMLGGGGTTVVVNAPVEIHTVAGDPAAIERVVLDAIGRAHVRGMTALKP